MGGQACVFYGAAQVSKDIDFLILADEENFRNLRLALENLQARRIAIPPFLPEALARGHAVHFRCQAPVVEGLRIDVMTRLRALRDFEALWQRRTVFTDGDGMEFHLLSVPDLVEAKKTQRSKDWPVIEALVAIHYTENSSAPNHDWIRFWLMEARSPELLVELCTRFQKEALDLQKDRPLLSVGIQGDVPLLRAEIQTETMREQEKDRLYWEPLKREMEEFRRAERTAPQENS
jgi:hypothetical protein